MHFVKIICFSEIRLSLTHQIHFCVHTVVIYAENPFKMSCFLRYALFIAVQIFEISYLIVFISVWHFIICHWYIWEFFIFSIFFVDVKVLIRLLTFVCVYKLTFLIVIDIHDLGWKFILCGVSVPREIFWILGFVKITYSQIIIIFLNSLLFYFLLYFVI